MWINTKTYKTYKFHSEIRSDFSDTSIPDVITDFVLLQLGVATVELSTPPEGYVVYELPPLLINDHWKQQWGIKSPTADETAIKQIEIRAIRNQKLLECDWTQVADSPVDILLWKTYRQQLRDISNQPEFPWVVEWPIAPAK